MKMNEYEKKAEKVIDEKEKRNLMDFLVIILSILIVVRYMLIL